MPLVSENRLRYAPSCNGTQVSLVIDGRAVMVPEGTSIMRAALKRASRCPSFAPPIRSKPSAPAAFASSRLRAAPAHPPLHVAGCVRHGRVDADRAIEKIRRGVMELYISDHPLDC